MINLYRTVSSLVVGAALASAPGPTQARGYRVVYAFQGEGGDAYPSERLTAVNGLLYGIASDSGPGFGSVFEVDPTTGKETTLHAFTDTGDGGYNPDSDLAYIDGLLYGTTLAGGYGSGVLFSLDPATGDFQVVHAFGDGADGSRPQGSPIQVGHTLYGTTSEGGTFGQGIIYAVDQETGHYKVLHSFTGTPGGSTPTGDPIYGQGVLYGTTNAGGTHGMGTVFMLNPQSKAFEVIYNFQGGSDGSDPGGDLLLSNNMLYGTTGGGGPQNDGTVFSFDPATGVEQVLHSFAGLHDSAFPAAGLVKVADALEGVTFGGSKLSKGTVFSLNPTTGTKGVLHRFVGGSDGSFPEAGLLDVGGVLYGTTHYGGDGSYGTVFAITP